MCAEGFKYMSYATLAPSDTGGSTSPPIKETQLGPSTGMMMPSMQGSHHDCSVSLQAITRSARSKSSLLREAIPAGKPKNCL